LVDVRPDFYCLRAIPNTDGKSLAREAHRCDENNPDRRAVYGQCTIVSQRVDYRMAEDILRKSTTSMHDDQRETVRQACSFIQYDCY
jgi:hypothetical protein